MPVTTSGTTWPISIEYVSIIHAIVCSFVAMSGAGMSVCGPISRTSSDVKRRVSRSSSRCDSACASQRMPPFAPPYGSRSSAHFHVIHDRERRALAERHLRVVADAALRRPEHGRVLHAVAREDLDRAVVAAQRHATITARSGKLEPLRDHVRDVGVRQRLLELGARHQEERRVPLQRVLQGLCLHGGHGRRSLGLRRATPEGAFESVADTRDRGRE